MDVPTKGLHMLDKNIHRDEFRLRILLTNKCNKACHFCLNDFQPKEPVHSVHPTDTVDCLRAYGTFMKSIKKKSIVTFSGGEPGLHTWLPYILRYAKYNCDIVKVVTNGEALRPDLRYYVDCWHVGVTDMDERVVDFLQYSDDITVQIVVTDEDHFDYYLNLIDYYHKPGIKIKLFTDFKSNRQYKLSQKIENLMRHFGERVSTRFTGKQENRGAACAGCKKKCVTLKALWMFPDGSSSTCPQGVVDKFDDDSWDETVEKAYNAHLYE